MTSIVLFCPAALMPIRSPAIVTPSPSTQMPLGPKLLVAFVLIVAEAVAYVVMALPETSTPCNVSAPLVTPRNRPNW
jgi:hypothetical protein